MKPDEQYWLQLRRNIENEPKTEIEQIIDKYADKRCGNCTYEEWVEAVIIMGNLSNENTSRVGGDLQMERELYESHCTAANYWDKEEDF